VKTVEDVVETCQAAKNESGETFVHFNGGFQGSRSLAAAEPYVRAVKERVGLLVGLQLTPERAVLILCGLCGARETGTRAVGVSLALAPCGWAWR
jgi:hypothetical protein